MIPENSSPSPTPPPPAAAAWHRAARERQTVPRPAKPTPPFAWFTEKEIAFVVAHVPEDRGRRARCVALWAALAIVANRRRSPRFTVRRRELAALSGLSGDAVVDALADLEAAGMVARTGPPTPKGQPCELRQPAAALTE